jgi:hypothetical protein
MKWRKVPMIAAELLKVFLFYLVGVLFYHFNMGWTVVDCIYFITVTITSVG